MNLPVLRQLAWPFEDTGIHFTRNWAKEILFFQILQWNPDSNQNLWNEHLKESLGTNSLRLQPNRRSFAWIVQSGFFRILFLLLKSFKNFHKSLSSIVSQQQQSNDNKFKLFLKLALSYYQIGITFFSSWSFSLFQKKHLFKLNLIIKQIHSVSKS